MKLAVFTSNQPRHTALLRALCALGDVEAVIEPKSFLPWGESSVLRNYWQRVQAAELDLFGERGRVPDAHTLSIRCVVMGEVSKLFRHRLGTMLDADRFVVFGSSWLRDWLATHLIERGAINLHVGIAPEYRGSAPNAWAFYDGHPELIGAQVQRLSAGLDAGDILEEVRPPLEGDYFHRSMLAVKLGIDAVVRVLGRPEPWQIARANDRTQQIRYAKHSDFSEAIAAEMLERA